MAEESKVVIITGASSGIGAGIARKLAAGGFRLVLGARRAERLAEMAKELGGEIAWRETNVASEADMKALADLAIERFGRVDVLVNNAGAVGLGPLANGGVADWERMIDVNVKGTLYGIHAVLPHMLARGDGQIINISSISGHGVIPGATVYSATKAAVNFISEGLRRETAGKIRVTALSPGGVQTEMTGSNRLNATPLLTPEMLADAVDFVIRQPEIATISEMTIRPIYEA